MWKVDMITSNKIKCEKYIPRFVDKKSIKQSYFLLEILFKC